MESVPFHETSPAVTKQPCAGVAVLFAGGILLGGLIPDGPSPAWILGFSGVLAAGAVLISHRISVLLAAALVVAGWGNLYLQTSVMAPDDLRLVAGDGAQLATIRGRLAATPVVRVHERFGRWTTNTQALVDAREMECPDGRRERVSGRVLVVTTGLLPPGFWEGLCVRVGGVLQPPPGPAAPGLFDYRRHLFWRGIHFQLRSGTAGDWEMEDPAKPVSMPWSERFQAWGRSILAYGLPREDEELRLLWAMTLGWKEGVTDELEEPFMLSGTLHIFAISGLHIGLIAAILVQSLRFLLIPRIWIGLVVLPVVWAYTAATGWQPSAIRSTLMTSIVVGGWMLARPVDLLNSLAVAAFVVLAWDPRQLFQAGFQLSFAVVGAIGLGVPWLETRLRGAADVDPFLAGQLIPGWRHRLRQIWRGFAANLAVSVSAFLGSLPLAAWHFHLVTPASLIANLLVVPLSSCALASNLGSLACGAWAPGAATLFNHSAWLWMHWMLAASRWSASLPGGAWYVARPLVSMEVLWYLVLVAVGCGWLRSQARRRWLCVIGAALGVVAWFEWTARQVVLKVVVIPLHGGHVVSVEHPAGTSLFDSGDPGAAEAVVQPFLHAQGINRLDELWLSHGDVRHVGGASDVASWFQPRQILINRLRFRSGPYRLVMEDLRTRFHDELRMVADGSGAGFWKVLHPGRADVVSRADDGCLVVEWETPESRSPLLLVSDLSRPGQESMSQRHPGLRADVVIAGLPTGSEPLSDGFLDQLDPRLVIVADALQPATARARPELMARLRRRACPVWFTSETGSLELRLKGKNWAIRDAAGRELWPESRP